MHVHNITIQCTDTVPLQSSRSHSVIIQSVRSTYHYEVYTPTLQDHYTVYTMSHFMVYTLSSFSIIHCYTVLLYSVTSYIMEVLSVEVTINNLNFLICLTYRPTNYTEQYDTLQLSYLRSFDDSTDLLIVGDLNLPDVDWNTYSSCTTISNTYAEMILYLNLMQLIDSLTHITGNVLDMILTNTDYC